MAIVDAIRLNRFLGGPTWDADQQAEAADILDEVEDELANRLNTKITTETRTEQAPILASGQVMTDYPVASVSSINGTTIPDWTPLPSGWIIQDHRLYAVLSTIPYQQAPYYTLSGGPLPRDWVQLIYAAGWGNVPALRQAILRKAGARFNNRNDHTVLVRDLDATDPQPLTPEDWTDEEIANLSRFYNHVVRR